MTDYSKREFLKLAAGAALLGSSSLLRACKNSPTVSESELKLLNFQFECKGHEDRASSVQSAFSQYVQGGNADQLGKLYLQMSKLSDMYLSFLQQCAQQGFHIKIVDQLSQFPDAAGLCMGGMNGDRPQYIELAHKSFSSTHVALHELGHACHSYAGRTPTGTLPYGLDFEDGLQRTFQETTKNGEGRKMWSYARTNTREFLAVSFSSFYCGDGARADMASSFPTTHTFFSSVLQPPPTGGAFGSQTTDTAATGVAQTPDTSTLPPTNTTSGSDILVTDKWQEWVKAMQDAAQIIADQGLNLTATGSTKGSRESGRIVRPSWEELHAGEILIVEIMPYRIVKPEQLRLVFHAGGQRIDLNAQFQVDILNKEHLSARVRLPEASQVFKNYQQNQTPCHLGIYHGGTLLAHSEHLFLRLHHDETVPSPLDVYRRG